MCIPNEPEFENTWKDPHRIEAYVTMHLANYPIWIIIKTMHLRYLDVLEIYQEI